MSPLELVPTNSDQLLASLPANLRKEARELVHDVQSVADGLRQARRRATMELAPRIADLKAKLCHHGGNRTKSEHSVLVKWEDFVAVCFGVSVDTIDNWLDAYEARGRFVTLLNGEEVTYTAKDPLTKEVKQVVVPPDKFPREVLAAQLDDIDLGNKPATRAWAGLQTGQPSGSKRAAVDHLAVWKKSCVSLRAENYRALIGKQKSVAIADLCGVLLQLPEDARAIIVDELKRSLTGGGR